MRWSLALAVQRLGDPELMEPRVQNKHGPNSTASWTAQHPQNKQTLRTLLLGLFRPFPLVLALGFGSAFRFGVDFVKSVSASIAVFKALRPFFTVGSSASIPAKKAGEQKRNCGPP